MSDAAYIPALHPDGLIRESRRLNARALEELGAMPNPNPRRADCPVCGAVAVVPFVERGGWAIDRCKCCDFWFTNPTPTVEQIGHFYNSPAKEMENRIHEDTRAERLEIFRDRVAFVLRFIRSGRLLEVGGAIGLFLDALTETNATFDLSAVEVSADACRRLAGRFPGISVHNQDFLDHRGRYDAVVMWDTIGYMTSPAKAIDHASGMLETGGHLILCTLNTESFEYGIARENHPQVQPIPTLNYFNTANLTLLLEQAGFEVLDAVTPNAHLDVRLVRQMTENGTVDRGRLGSFLGRHLSDDEFANGFAELLRRRRLGGNVTVAARKI